MLLEKFIQFLSSLRLTVVCLAMALVLVFAGTLAQVHLGLYLAQQQYFQSLFVFWTPKGSELKIPVWPGGYLLGWVLLANLIAAHIKRFEPSRKKLGIFVIHAGLILLLLGQFMTEVLQVESYMTLAEGETKNYSESGRRNELVIIDRSNPEYDYVVAIPESRLAANKVISHPQLPFSIKVNEYHLNTSPELEMPKTAFAGMQQDAPAGKAGLLFKPAPEAIKMNDRNIPAATVEIEGASTAGKWTVSNWLVEERLASLVRKQFGRHLDPKMWEPQRFTHQGKEYEIAMRPVRYYKSFSIQLMDFTHERYKGTDIPKNFSSRVRLMNAESKEDREILIYMNNPLRYGGETFYQGGFEPGDTVSILQVVRNPSWLAPYVACALVGLGLTVQFMSHLIGFIRRRKTA